MPIHGHTKIELTNQTTGEVEVVEKDNLVTNAVSQIFNAFNGVALLREANANGEAGTRYYTPGWQLLESLYGGLLLYDTALDASPDTLFAPASAHLVGSGVPKVLNNGNGLQRGSFNAKESKTDLENGVVTFVYDFGTHQANGIISSVCLTNRYGGFYAESDTKLSSTDGANNSAYIESNLFGSEAIFPQAFSAYEYAMCGRPLYADPENDEMVFAGYGWSDSYQLWLRHASALTKEIDLFNPVGTTRRKRTDKLDLDGLAQSHGLTYTAVDYDVDADKICAICLPGSYKLDTNGIIRVRTFDRKTLEAKTYQFTNPTGAVLRGYASDGSTGSRGVLSNNARVLGGCLIMAGYSTSSSTAVPFYKIPLEDPTRVSVIETHGLLMPYFSDKHDGRIYWLGNPAYPYGAVMNLETNEIRAIEAYYNNGNTTPHFVVPTLGQPAVPMIARYNENDYSMAGTIRQGIRRNYLATINNLDTPVQKTADKTMKITYTLRKEEA